jgi:hypothetical protein
MQCFVFALRFSNAAIYGLPKGTYTRTFGSQKRQTDRLTISQENRLVDTPDTSSAPVSVPHDPGLSSRGLWQVFVSPAEFFGKLKDQPKIIVPLVVLFVLTMLLVAATWKYSAQVQIDQLNRMAQRGIPVGPIPSVESLLWRSYLGSLVLLLPPFLCAALALFAGNVLMGGRAGYKHLLSIMIYGDIIWAVGNLLKVPLIWAKDSLAVGFSLATLVADRGAMSPLFIALDRVGVFYIWEMVAVAIGITVIYGFSKGKGYTVAIISLLIPTLLIIGMTWVGSAFAGL